MPVPQKAKTASKKVGGWLAICITVTAASEGLRTVAYRDPVGIPTICFGETKNVRMGMEYTRKECEDMLGRRLLEFDDGVSRCTTVYLPDQRRAAIVSFAYNVGVPTYCASSVARKLNAGDVKGGCQALMLYNKARKAGILITLPGLTRRRTEEREMCLAEAA